MKSAKNKNEAKPKNKKKKQKKEKHQNVMKELPPTCYSCATHQNDYLRIIPHPSKNPPTCKSCGIKMEGKYGYFCCPKSMSCFHVCSACRVCPKDHILRNFTSDVLYSENKFTCHGCKQVKTVGSQRGILHCGPCNFSICVQCEQSTNDLWDKMNRSEEEDQ